MLMGEVNGIIEAKKDIVLFCAPSIPGQEAGRFRLLAQLRQKGIKFLTRQEKKLYAHAHARLPELREMAKMIKGENWGETRNLNLQVVSKGMSLFLQIHQKQRG